MPDPTIQADAIIFGGGVAGLWTLHELTRRGRAAILLEARALGQGQTLWSQGIIHGGLKYTLTGLLTGSAEAIRDMPALWRRCLAGEGTPDLRGVRLRAPSCWLWQTASLMSRVGMIGARVGLRVAPEVVEPARRPAVLRACPGTVAELAEQVIEPASLIAALAAPHAGRLMLTDPERTTLSADASGATVHAAFAGRGAVLRAPAVILTAGNGNAHLRRLAGLDPAAMQVRPLRMVLLRADPDRLPELNGHCVDGSRTRVTITTTADDSGRRVWQIGGQVAEDGVSMTPDEAIAHARAELLASVPGLNTEHAEWSTYDAPRAELAAGGKRPEDVSLAEDGPIITAFPTKLALAPRLADRAAEAVARRAPTPTGPGSCAPEGWPAPAVAAGPWDEPRPWRPDRETRPARG
ncbi:MAG: FAD-dependent oxidoreductase [Phycisphaerales bacterium]|nr:FAD-dependent oxidoreductase [Phycisphaerales bacterium]